LKLRITPVCLGTLALMRGDGLQQILRSPVMQEKEPLTKPQSGAVRNSSPEAAP